MVDIQSATAEIRRGKNIERKVETGRKYNVRICCAGRPQITGQKHVQRGEDKRVRNALVNIAI